MYDLTDFIPYVEGTVTIGSHKVLAWSKKHGYYFTQYGFCADPEIKIIAQENKV